MPTVVHGDFEWDDEKARSNLAKHGVSFEEAAVALTDPRSMDFEDLVEPDRLITLASSPSGRILYVVTTERDHRLRIVRVRAVLAMRPYENDAAMQKPTDPSAEALDEMPEIDEERFRRRPGRGHHALRDAGEIVTIEPEIWAHFGSAEAVRDALRQVIADRKKAG